MWWQRPFLEDLYAYLELRQVFGHDVRADLVPLDNVSSVLCVSTHRAGAVSLVEAAADILGGELEMAVLADHQSLSWPHGFWSVEGL